MGGSTEPVSREIPQPPSDLVDVVGGAFEIGSGHLAQLRERTALEPHEHVLDVGCGVGRTAVPLTAYLSQQGAYEGFDIWPGAIDWCRREITSRFPNFRFQHIDVFNAAYNPGGAVTPSELTFPYDDESFDVAFLHSVFTHLVPPDLERYLSEIARVLKEGGRLLATFFLLNHATLDKLARSIDAVTPEGNKVARFLLKRDLGGYWGGFAVPEWMVAYDEEWVRDAYRRHGLAIEEPITAGEWVEWATGAAEDLGRQDVIVAQRGSR